MALPKFNLRDLFWLVVVVAMGLGWWVERSKLHAELESSRFRLSYWPQNPGEKLEVELDEKGVQTITKTADP